MDYIKYKLDNETLTNICHNTVKKPQNNFQRIVFNPFFNSPVNIFRLTKTLLHTGELCESGMYRTSFVFCCRLTREFDTNPEQI